MLYIRSVGNSQISPDVWLTLGKARLDYVTARLGIGN